MHSGGLTAADRAAFLDQLFADEAIRLKRGAIFDQVPATLSPDPDRLSGMMLGLAAGDSLGAPSESMTPGHRRAAYREIRDYLPNRYADNRPVGTPTDDSQMAFWTLEQLVEDGQYIPDALAKKFSERRIYGIGRNVRQFIANYKDSSVPWFQAGPKSAGNGSLMRIAPMVYPHLRQPSTELWVDTTLSAMATHNDSAATGSCMAFVAMIWDLLSMDQPPAPEWWATRFCEVLEDVDFGSRYAARGGEYTDRRETFPTFVAFLLEEFTRRELTTLEAGNAAYSGAYLLETVPSVLYILQCHGDDPEEAIVRAVNDTRDCDTVAAIVGAAVGALHGKEALPKRWIDNLTGRTMADDDDRMFELLDDARRIFIDPPEVDPVETEHA